jgi:dTDP-4-amino-4,6-dideoxygalactose transaminase
MRGTWVVDRGRSLESYGNVVVFAFYPDTRITTGEDGMVVDDSATGHCGSI